MFITQFLFSLAYGGQTKALANGERNKSRIYLTLLSVLFLTSTSIGVEAWNEGNYIICLFYVLGNLSGNEFCFKKENNGKIN